MVLKELLRKCLGAHICGFLRELFSKINEMRLAITSREKVFTEIYKKNVWGGCKGEYCSGYGSRDENIVAAYVKMIALKIRENKITNASFIDLGCGDFYVGARLLQCCNKYLGVDVVKFLIDNNSRIYGNEKVSFKVLDIVNDNLPEGDVCLIRQVLQHLSNAEIVKILPKLKIYKFVFITEHYPIDTKEIVPNIDTVHGGGIRATNNSGVYLSSPPFSISKDKLELVLEVSGTGLGREAPSGVIRTYLYKPQS
jgi:hypothetical protein